MCLPTCCCSANAFGSLPLCTPPTNSGCWYPTSQLHHSSILANITKHHCNIKCSGRVPPRARISTKGGGMYKLVFYTKLVLTCACLKDPLRRCLGSALQWYNHLQNTTTEFVDSVLAVTCSSLDECDEKLKDHGIDEGEEGGQKHPHPEEDKSIPLTCPSEYPWCQCALCFGGKSRITRGWVATMFSLCIHSPFQ